MAVELRIQASMKISYSNDEELQDKLNKLCRAVGDLRIEPTTPDATDTKHWVIVHYWRRE